MATDIAGPSNSIFSDRDCGAIGESDGETFELWSEHVVDSSAGATGESDTACG